MSPEGTSLNKFISNTGLCSRREADRMIEHGRVMVNGEEARKGYSVMPGDKVMVDGRLLKHKPRDTYIMLHKPPGITCTTDQRDPSNIIDFIGHKERIFPIGRLDKGSTGLILLTNDGDIVNKVLRKENRHEKEYIVGVDRPFDNNFLQRMSRPMRMLGTTTLPCKVTRTGPTTFRIILTQGLNRQIRRMCEQCGYKVLTLKRTRIMHLPLGKLKVGEWRYLTKEESGQLLDHK
jgi:23S rRNA pseudouridine2604 synthase